MNPRSGGATKGNDNDSSSLFYYGEDDEDNTPQFRSRIQQLGRNDAHSVAHKDLASPSPASPARDSYIDTPRMRLTSISSTGAPRSRPNGRADRSSIHDYVSTYGVDVAAGASKVAAKRPFLDDSDDETPRSPPSARLEGVASNASLAKKQVSPVERRPATQRGAITGSSLPSGSVAGRFSAGRPDEASGDAALSRQQRIERKAERNRRNREIDEQAARAEAAEEIAVTQEPFALNSARGVQAIRSIARNTSHDRKLGRITEHDIHLIIGKRQGSDWTQLALDHESRTGQRRATETIRRRHKQVKKAIEAAKVPPLLWEDVHNNVRGAEDRLNALVQESLRRNAEQTGEASESSKRPNTPTMPSLPTRAIFDTSAPAVEKSSKHPSTHATPSLPTRVISDTSAPAVDKSSKRSVAHATPSVPTRVISDTSAPAVDKSSKQSTTHATPPLPPRAISGIPAPAIVKEVQHNEADSEQQDTERPTTGGKRPSWALLQTTWNAQAESAEESDVASQASQVSQDPQGFMHFDYQVQRRECTKLRTDTEGTTIDDAQWHDVDEPYTSLSKANAVASADVLLMNYGKFPIVNGERFSIKHDVDGEGAALCEYVSDFSKVQTRVTQRVRTFRDRIPARNKDGWLSRTLYHVKQRITRRAGDGLFEERGAIVELRETFVDECTSADLAWANSKAINKFVEKTFKPRSANLHLRDAEIGQMKEDLKDTLYKEGDGAMFHSSKETAQGLLEIWVERGRLLGPRNL